MDLSHITKKLDMNMLIDSDYHHIITYGVCNQKLILEWNSKEKYLLVGKCF
jgi:hypothetical protein